MRTIPKLFRAGQILLISLLTGCAGSTADNKGLDYDQLDVNFEAVPQTMKERAVLFISERLVIVVDRHDIVNNMHEAYSVVENDSYGCFISGPSKTADIAQALVMGAQAAREVVVLIK